jgi:membrane-bound lytic murein transglycosylase D
MEVATGAYLNHFPESNLKSELNSLIQRPFESPSNGESDFKTPESLEPAVRFWVKIYSQFTSSEGLIHDAENLNIIYDTVSFREINSDSELNEKQKWQARENLITQKKKAIFESLQKLKSGVSDSELTAKDMAIKDMWAYFGKNKSINEISDYSRIRFQLGQADHLSHAMYLSGRYQTMMEKIFSEQGLPKQLTRIVFVESSFNVLARSKVGASGLWQIMPSVAKGQLTMNNTVDLRNHPEAATIFAARMLKVNFEMLGSWELAVTGYNFGPYGIKKLIEKNNTNNLSELISIKNGKNFGFASRNFYACLLAVLRIENNSDFYFPLIIKSPELNFENLKIQGKTKIRFSDLVEKFNGNRELAQLYNPHLQKEAYLDKVDLDSKSWLIIPKDTPTVQNADQKAISEAKKQLALDSVDMNADFQKIVEVGLNMESKSF